ncbi:MAG: hypothetical protein GWN07_01980 [Actinobacteria bacterium]|nr:hypothetical protein [Actinomycetota bacterium]NIW26104.1 hypothetical protein [Actinomycetota bacterium]NIX18674.1 hypothetical protein [Actinomycetota bacterium]
MRHALITMALGSALACGSSPAMELPDSGPGSWPDHGPRCPDEDGDGIADRFEGTGDADGDGIPNTRDLDSDGDGFSDADEGGTDGCASPIDLDRDGTYDAYDWDRDGDALADADEEALGFDPTHPDTDRDGCPDLAEIEFGECADQREAFIVASCATPDHDTVSLPYLVDIFGRGTETLDDVRLAIESPENLATTTRAVAVSPAGAATIAFDHFETVESGALLSFELSLESHTPDEDEVTHAPLFLVAVGPSGDVRRTLNRGQLVVFGGRACPTR